MARVKRFIYNSDFMTIAHVGSEQIMATIPAGQTSGGVYSGELSFPLDIPERSFARVRLKYTGSFRTVDMACAGFFMIQASKSGKTIQYMANLAFEPGKLKIIYYVNNATDTSTVLTDAVTVTLLIDFLQQPNT